MRRLKKIGIYVSICIVVSVLVIFLMDRAGGEVPDGLKYTYPELSDSENAAFLYRAAWSALKDSDEGTGRDTFRLLKLYNDASLQRAGIGDLYAATPSASELERLPLILAEAEPAFALLRQARETKGCLYLDDHSPEAVYTNLDKMLETAKVTRNLSKYIIARALWEAEQGDIDAALDWLVTGLHFANDLGDESMRISEGVRKIIGFQMLLAAQGILYEHSISGPVPQALLDEIDDLRDRKYHGDSLRRESASSKTLMQAQGRWWFPLQSIWRRNYLETLSAFLDAVEVDDYDERVGRMRLVWDTVDASRTGYKKYINYYDSILIAPLFPDEEVLETLIAHADLLELGLFLRAYEHDHGAFPETLAGLVPEYLPEIPEDPLNGKEYYYESMGPRATIASEVLTMRGGVVIHLGPTSLDASTL